MPPLKVEFPSFGWEQILSSRQKILDDYDRAKQQAQVHKVAVYHGRVAEASVREWLSGFLPRRYGVTSGYVISAGLSSEKKAPHFDVIIFDQLESPVLWIEEHPDTSGAGRSLAVPVEHVKAVLEVKSRLSATTMREALSHLADLMPLMQSSDEPSQPYKLHLPDGFCCGVIFIELGIPESKAESTLASLMEGLRLRGFLGALVLRGEGHTLPSTGRLSIVRSETPIESTWRDAKTPSLLEFGLSKSIEVAQNVHMGAMAMWAELHFSQFAFDLVALLQGTYRPGFASSIYGVGSSWMEVTRHSRANPPK
ncbi:MAG TPA: DUF6602 domain-containing protein [Terriglobales bacterium]|nr:DUF6602 domain-containing protein [Terriglobales bacterium]